MKRGKVLNTSFDNSVCCVEKLNVIFILHGPTIQCQIFFLVFIVNTDDIDEE